MTKEGPLNRYKYWIYYAVIFTLPMFTVVNNALLVALIILGLFEILTSKDKLDLKKFLFVSWPILGFFGLSILASFRSVDFQAIKYLENHWSLLLVPLIMLYDSRGFSARKRQSFLMLLWGSMTTLLICNINYWYSAIKKGRLFFDSIELSNFGHQFTEVADTHPAYLGLFLFTSILFVIQDGKFPKWSKTFILAFLLIGLIQLTSSIALLLFVLFLLYVGIYKTKHEKHQSLFSIIGLVVCAFVFLMFGRSFMSGKLFFVDAILDVKRIQRWEVSYEIFRENPVIGVGYSNIDSARSEKYMAGDYMLAYDNDLNAHNQFLEYLSITGVFGGIVYAVALVFLFLLSIERKDHLFTFVIFAFILANLTESMMVRIKGIEYYAIFASLFLCSGKSFILNKTAYGPPFVVLKKDD